MSILAANAREFAAAFDLLRSWGWGDYLSSHAGWETRSNGKAPQPFTQAINHHTGSRSTPTSYLLSPRDRPDLVILANIHVKQTGHVILLAAGPTSHAGMTHKACYDRIAAGTAPLDRDLIPGADSATFSANRHTVGIEADGAGGPSDWTVIEYRMMVALNAALNIAFGWTASGGAPRSGGHKEHTRRKPGDPWPSMGRFRAEVADFIRSPRRPDWSPAITNTSQEDDMPTPTEIAAALLDAEVPREGLADLWPAAEGEPTTLRKVLAWSDAQVLGAQRRTEAVEAKVEVLQAAVAALAHGSDAAEAIRQAGEEAAAKIEAALPAEITYRREVQA